MINRLRQNVKGLEITGFVLATLSMLSVFIISLPLYAQEDEGFYFQTKEVTGEVGVVRPPFMAIVYKKDKRKGIEYEIALRLDKDDVLIERKDSLDQIHQGDTVRVVYEEKQKEYEVTNEKGRKEIKRKVVSRDVKKIIFVRAKPKGLRSQ